MSKKRTVQSYPNWRQIEFDDITLTRGDFQMTEKLSKAEVVWAAWNCSTRKVCFRLRVKGKMSEYLQ